MMERAFVIAAQGDRRTQVQRLVKNIRSYSALPIHILTTVDSVIGLGNPLAGLGINPDKIYIEYVEPVWTKGPRAAIRNCNFWKVDFALRHHYHSLCMLDDDMLIVNKDFVAGFGIAERFGVAIPANPRTFNKYNLMGADVRIKDWIECCGAKLMMPAVNFSPFFVYPHNGLTTNFLRELQIELKTVPCRGTVAIIKAMWNSRIAPIILPEQWCVCGSSAERIKSHTKLLRGKQVSIPAIMLHLGHKEVQEVYGIN